jgi:tetratricopeptide (TPR) repeat protein
MSLFLSFFLMISFITVPFFSSFCSAEQGIFLTEDLQLRVADTFLAEGEYYRAVTEYKRFSILFPESTKGDYALFRTGIASYLGDEQGDALRSFETLANLYPDGNYTILSRYFAGLSLWKKKDYAGAAETFDRIARSAPDSQAAPRALAAWALLELDRDDPSATEAVLQRFIADYPDHPEIGRIRESLALLHQYQKLPQKSELLAGILSAILPGAGYVYAERYGDGITAFLINALFVAGTVTAVTNDWYPAAGITGGIGLPFYFGNIYGSANAAKKWNRTRKREVRGRIVAVLDDIIDDKNISPLNSAAEGTLSSPDPDSGTETRQIRY